MRVVMNEGPDMKRYISAAKLHGGLLFSVDWWYRLPVWHLDAV